MARKDSRLRTVQREAGKVFVIWFGGVYGRPPESQFAVGDPVDLVEGSAAEAAVMRNPKKPEAGTEKWALVGVQGGDKARPKFEEEWKKFLAGEKSHGLRVMDVTVPEKEPEKSKQDAVLVSPKVTGGELPGMDEIREVAKNYEFRQMVKRVAVMFPNRGLATSFRIAATKRGWKTSNPLTDENNGETEVLVQSK